MEKKKYSRPEISREELQQQLFEANMSLQEANERLRQEERMRTEFFANLSHDLRAPMTALASAVEYLKTGTVTGAELDAVLELMGKRTAFLQRLIEDMFLLAKMENADTAMHLIPLDAGAFLEEYFYSCEADAAYSGRKLTLELPEELDCEIQIDPEMMVRVLDNLFTNARKYSREGDTITLTATKTEAGLEITVADTGIGIAPEELPHIFERSYRTTKARTPGDDSSGLGLAIVQKILERHGSKITAESTVGEGTTFRFVLPIVA